MKMIIYHCFKNSINIQKPSLVSHIRIWISKILNIQHYVNDVINLQNNYFNIISRLFLRNRFETAVPIQYTFFVGWVLAVKVL